MLQYIIQAIYDKQLDTRKQAVLSLNRLISGGLAKSSDALSAVLTDIQGSLSAPTGRTLNTLLFLNGGVQTLPVEQVLPLVD
jgi:hypothetical protein